MAAPLILLRSTLHRLHCDGSLNSGLLLAGRHPYGDSSGMFPAVFELALQSQFWHAFEHASFFLAGILFWWPVIQPGLTSTLVRSGCIFSLPRYPAMLFRHSWCFAAMSCTGHICPDHGGLFGLSPLEDQALAGALMWVTVTFAYLIPALVLTGPASLERTDERRRSRGCLDGQFFHFRT